MLIPDGLLAHESVGPLLKGLGAALSPLPSSRLNSANGERTLQHYDVASLDGLGSFSRAELSAAGALIAYLDLTQKGRQTRLSRLARVTPANFMAIDQATRRNLELTQTLSGARGRQPARGDRPHRDGGGRPRTGVAIGRAAYRCEGHRNAA